MKNYMLYAIMIIITLCILPSASFGTNPINATLDETKTYAGIQTWATTDPQTNSITLNGWVNSTHDVWFRWGSSTDKIVITPIQSSINGAFSYEILDYPITKGYTYYYSAGCYDGYNGTLTFILPGADPVPTTTYTQKLTELTLAKNNLSALNEVISSVYTDRLGPLFYGMIWIVLLGAIWLRTEDIKIPLMAYILLSGTLSLNGMFPENVVYFIYMSIVLAMAALLYSLFKKGQK
jgi:hypothetical protein